PFSPAAKSSLTGHVQRFRKSYRLRRLPRGVLPDPHPGQMAGCPQPDRAAFVILPLPEFIRAPRRNNFRILAMLTNQQGRGSPYVDVGNHCIGSPDWLTLENFVVLGKGDPRLLAARPDVPGRPQPRCIVERTRPDTNQAVSGRA